MLALIIASGLLLLPAQAFSQMGSSMDMGGTTFHNFGSVSGSSQQLGSTEFYNFSNGTNATRQSLGNVDFFSSNAPSLNRTMQSIGGMTFGNWGDGTSSQSQSIGGTTFHNFSNGQRCTSQRVGNQTFTNCH
ncbi:MAG: hypothetical protein H0X01_09330 [Nitrospira sp.]|nr:hypothetical protein [Nitrospira sp.]